LIEVSEERSKKAVIWAESKVNEELLVEFKWKRVLSQKLMNTIEELEKHWRCFVILIPSSMALSQIELMTEIYPIFFNKDLKPLYGPRNYKNNSLNGYVCVCLDRNMSWKEKEFILYL